MALKILATASELAGDYGQGVPSATTRASTIAPRMTARKVIRAFTRLSFRLVSTASAEVTKD